MNPVLATLVPEMCAALLAAHGVRTRWKAAKGPSVPLESTTATNVGGLATFGGTAMTGTVLFATSFEFLASCCPPPTRKRLSPDSAGDWILVRDWSRELTNQLLGRIKNRLVASHVTFDTHVPMAVTREEVAASAKRMQEPPFIFAAGASELTLWFDAVVRSPGELVLRDGVGVPEEGDVLVF